MRTPHALLFTFLFVAPGNANIIYGSLSGDSAGESMTVPFSVLNLGAIEMAVNFEAATGISNCAPVIVGQPYECQGFLNETAQIESSQTFAGVSYAFTVGSAGAFQQDDPFSGLCQGQSFFSEVVADCVEEVAPGNYVFSLSAFATLSPVVNAVVLFPLKANISATVDNATMPGVPMGIISGGAPEPSFGFLTGLLLVGGVVARRKISAKYRAPL